MVYFLHQLNQLFSIALIVMFNATNKYCVHFLSYFPTFHSIFIASHISVQKVDQAKRA